MDFKRQSRDHTYIIGLEILDNMPHDRLYKEKAEDREYKY